MESIGRIHPKLCTRLLKNEEAKSCKEEGLFINLIKGEKEKA